MSAIENSNVQNLTQTKNNSISSVFQKLRHSPKMPGVIPQELQTPNSAISMLISAIILLYILAAVILVYNFYNAKGNSIFIRVTALIICGLSFMSFGAHMIFHCVLKKVARAKTIRKQLMVIHTSYVLFTLTHVITSSYSQFISLEGGMIKLTEMEMMLLCDYIFLCTDVMFKFLWIVFFWNNFKCILIANSITVALVFLYAIAHCNFNFQVDNLLHLPLYVLFYVILTIISFKLKTCMCGKKESSVSVARTDDNASGCWNNDYEVMDEIASGYIVINHNSSPVDESTTNLNLNLNFSGGEYELKYFNKFFEKENEFMEYPKTNCSNSNSLSILSRVLSDLTQVNSKIIPSDENSSNTKTFSTSVPVQSQQSSIYESKEFVSVKIPQSEGSNLINARTNLTTSVTGTNVINNNNNNIHNMLDWIFHRVEPNGKFTYLGKKVMSKEDNRKTLVLEIYVRVTGSRAEFIFNDMTKYSLYNAIHQLILQSGQYLHDFKNPLICINDEMLELKLHNDAVYEILLENFPDYQEFNLDKYLAISDKFEYLIRMSEYCRGMIASYEDFSRMIFKPRELKINIEKIDLREMLTFLESMMKFKIVKSKKAINFELFNHCEGDVIYSDHIKLQQALMNILSNSLKFTSIGSISLTVSKEVIEGKRYAKFFIQDTGIGMAPNVVENLCTPFFSCTNGKMNQEGCGLGLLIVKELSEKLGIGLKISSVESKGTEMWFFAENQSPGQEELKQSGKKPVRPFWKARTMRQSPILERDSECDETTSQFNLSGEKTPKTPIASMGKTTSLNFRNKHTTNTVSNNPSIRRKHKTATITYFKPGNSLFSSFPQVRAYGSDKKIEYHSTSFNMKREISKERESDDNSSKMHPSELIQQLEISFEIKASLYSKLHISSSPKIFRGKSKVPSQASSNFGNFRDKSMSFFNVDQKLKDNLANKYSSDYNSTEFIGRDIEKSRSNGLVHSLFTGGTITDYANNIPGNQSDFKSEDNPIDSPQGSCVIHVLLIDDDDGIRANSKNLLMKIAKMDQKISFRIDEADDGFTGLVRIVHKSLHIPREKYDIIILDEEMNYLNGTDLYKMLSFITMNKFGSRSNFDMGILSRILICSADDNSIQSKIQIVPEAVVHKPLNFNFMSNYIRKICPV